MSNNYYLNLITPIKKPDVPLEPCAGMKDPFLFEKKEIFICYMLRGNQTDRIIKDDHGSWYYSTQIQVKDMKQAKIARQVIRPSYFDSELTLPMIDKLYTNNLALRDHSFDKAYAHLSLCVPDISSLSMLQQSRIANLDDDDDPQIATRIHYLVNRYNDRITRFIAGWETFSFATITDNQYYFEKIHLPFVAELYLMYFTYFVQYGYVPSKQMMARLLDNLWRSTSANRTDWNHSLVEITKFF